MLGFCESQISTARYCLVLQPWMTAPATCRVIKTLQATGAEVRFVGGCVRDALINREVHDVDLATSLTPDRVLSCLEEAGIKALLTGGAHGTVTAIEHDRTFEITTLRRDIETDGRHAKVVHLPMTGSLMRVVVILPLMLCLVRLMVWYTIHLMGSTI